MNGSEQKSNVNFFSFSNLNLTPRDMQIVLTATLFTLLMPITGSGWVEGSNVILDPRSVCKRPRRPKNRLGDICRNDSQLMHAIIRGINLSLDECQYQFRNSRWNCTVPRKNFQKLLAKDTRETGFVNAITAAGIAYSVSKACASGMVECTCYLNYTTYYNVNTNNSAKNQNKIDEGGTEAVGPKKKKGGRFHNLKKKLKKLGKNLAMPSAQWKWGGCDVQFGLNKSKIFLDARIHSKRDIKSLVKTHNNIAGLLTIRRYMQLKCRCHGMSGSCTMQTCWLVMPTFREIGDRLRDRYDGASKVIASNDGVRFMPEGDTIKQPTKEDLVYTEESPDFCRPNQRTGSMGTRGRECNETSLGDDGCDLLCCNRGFVSDIEVRTVSCDCKFEWCCEVKCQKCNETRPRHTCL